MSEREFINNIAPLAVAEMRESGILASVIIAQACLESAYGTSELAVNAKNLFGMKTMLSGNTWESIWDGTSEYQKRTQEQDKTGRAYYIVAAFRSYPDLAVSIRDHSLYLLQAMNGDKLRYAGLAGERDPRRAATIIKDGGYATDIRYVDKVCQIIARWELVEYDGKQFGEMSRGK